MPQEWTIRVIQFAIAHSGRPNRDLLPGVWIEQFRRLGYVRELAVSDVGETTERTVFEIYAPSKGHSSYVWANINAERMRTFGINAVAAPKWATEMNKKDATLEGHNAKS